MRRVILRPSSLSSIPPVPRSAARVIALASRGRPFNRSGNSSW
jgi:hypothetical protein